MPIVLSQSSNPGSFTARNRMFVPIERVTQPPTQPPSHPIVPFRGLVVLSGVALINFRGQGGDWLRDTVTLDINDDLRLAVANAPYKPRPGFRFSSLAIEQGVPFATVNARSRPLDTTGAAGPGPSDGSAADSFSLDPSRGAVLNIDVAVRDFRSEIFRLGYFVSLYGSLLEEPVVA